MAYIRGVYGEPLEGPRPEGDAFHPALCLPACLPAWHGCLLVLPKKMVTVESCNDGVPAAFHKVCSACCAVTAAMCSNYMARLDVANEEWHNCEGPQLSRLHAGVAGAAGEGAWTCWLTTIGLVDKCVESQVSWHMDCTGSWHGDDRSG